MIYKMKEGWTKQAMKEAILRHNDGTRAYADAIGQCVYRTEEGNRCAVGCFVPDEWIGEAEEVNGDVKELLDRIPELEEFMPLETEGLVQMQKVHDSEREGHIHAALLLFIDSQVH